MVECPRCETEHRKGERFDFGVIERADAAETSFFDCKHCGHMFDDTGKRYGDESDLPKGISK